MLRAFYPQVDERVAAFVEPVDALVARLSGRIVATATTAFPLMCTDNRVWSRVAYDPELVSRAGVDAGLLPPIVAGDEPVGPITAAAAQHLGITGGALVLPGTVDSITSAIGGGALDASRVALVVGTTSVIATHVDAKAADLAHGISSIPSPLAQRYFVMAENGVGGKALEFLLRNVVYADDAFATGAMPLASFRFEDGQCATEQPNRARSAISAGARCTACTAMNCGPSIPRFSSLASGRTPNFARLSRISSCVS